MFDITTEDTFSAAHYLRNYQGPCENPHGHNWLVRVTVSCDQLDEAGIGIDFRVLRGYLKEVLRQFDHRDLNESFVGPENPSSENIAHRIYGQMKQVLTRNAAPCRMARVEVFETPGNSTMYYESPRPC